MKRQSKKSEHITSNWTTEQDSFLIENSFMVIEQLINHLPFTEDEIINDGYLHVKGYGISFYKKYCYIVKGAVKKPNLLD